MKTLDENTPVQSGHPALIREACMVIHLIMQDD